MSKKAEGLDIAGPIYISPLMHRDSSLREIYREGNPEAKGSDQ
jgi:hypothetical protein